MSDQTPDSDEPEEDEGASVRPRHQSAAERRSSETVMLDSGNLDDMVAQAKATPVEPSSAPASEPASQEPDSSDSGNREMLMIAGVIVIVIIVFVVMYLVYKSR